MKYTVFKLGTPVTDSITLIKGSLIQLELRMDGRIWYLLQPKKLHPEDNSPAQPIWVTAPQVLDGQAEEIDLPFFILGTPVRDDLTGFFGNAVYLIKYITGCLHVGIQPPGVSPKTHSAWATCNFDLTRCSGEAITKMSEEKKQQERKDRPSPPELAASR